MKVELHCHSTCSDGTLAPEEVAERARAGGVELFCLTDHDTCAGSEVARRAFGGAALRGVELSCRHDGRTVHVLVFDTGGAGWSELEARLRGLHQARRGRARAIAERLAGLGIGLDAEAILEEAGESSVGRPHLARALVRAGAVQSTEEAFVRYLHDGGPADVPLEHLSLEEGIELGRAAGARMALAHPHTLGDRAAGILRRYRSHGLEGVEACYGIYGEKDRRGWLRLADELGLVVTAGSDFHGGTMPQIRDLGVELEEDRARRLRDWLDLELST